MAIVLETNTFSPMPTGLDNFTVTRKRDVDPDNPDFGMFDLFGLWWQKILDRGDEFIFSLVAFAQPAGFTVRAVYELLRDEMLDDLRAAVPVDIVLLAALHGAMIADGYDDCECDMMERVREIAGPDTVIGVALDLRCHLKRSDFIFLYSNGPLSVETDRTLSSRPVDR